jgi:peptidoglycan/xylan/chitin deacetylase (PgdA/CDA1 family)
MKKIIALTFDDGPCKRTEIILKILKKYNIKATFFVLGRKIRKNRKILEQMIRQKCEIENHCYSHKYWLKTIFKPESFWIQEIVKTDKKLSEIGIKTQFVRFPYFQPGFKGLIAAKKLNKEVIGVTLDSLDWFFYYRKEKIEKRILKKIKEKNIIGFHDYLENIGENYSLPEVLETIIPTLKNKGYHFITLKEIAKADQKKLF